MIRSAWLSVPVLLAVLLSGVGSAALADTPTPSPTPGAGPSGPPSASPSTPPSESSSPTPSASTSPNQPPVPADDSAVVEVGSTVRIDVLANDTDDGLGRAGGETPRLEVVALSDPRTGTTTFTADTVTFEAGDKAGDVSFAYTVSDGALESTATVSVRVEAKPKPPTVTIHLARKPVALHRYHVHGRVHPQKRGVVVRVQRRVGDHWRLLGRDRTNRKGQYAVGYRPDRAERQVFRAVADWHPHTHRRSEALKRRVTARPDVTVSGPLTRAQLPFSWRPGCPVAPAQLRRISVNGYDYSHRIHRGAVVVSASSVRAVAAVLRSAFQRGFPIRSMRPTDHFYAGGKRTPSQSDVAAMRADNTSAFNCRPVTGNPYRISQHSYGNAIDINTVRNPYVTGSRVYPSWARTYLDRSRARAGMILSRGVVATQMRHFGWLWGARWSHPDYQHFSSNGG